MKLEEVNTRTNEAADFLVAALESGHSEVLTAYLGAMAKFHGDVQLVNPEIYLSLTPDLVPK
jgi:hypothetical protein